jgi:flagellum-specific ATP synthase
MGRFDAAMQAIDATDLFPRIGTVTRISATYIEADGPIAAIGDLCRVHGLSGRECLAEVSAVGLDHVTLIPLDPLDDVRPGARVTAGFSRAPTSVGEAFRGRAVDGLARPIDTGPPIISDRIASRSQYAVAVLDRETPTAPLPTGIAAIDSLLTLGVGQRIGIFSASGVGKSSLMRQLAHHISCDHVVMCLVGERGREVEAIWRDHLKDQPDSKMTIIAATSDETAPMRVRAVDQALAIAEYWRAAGRHCLLIVDSITRYAMALREIGLASAEPPILRGYTPNVLKALPHVVEKCGRQRGGGAITSIFTVLSETDDVDDPIVEVMKSLLDGHIILSRSLAHSGHYPAIDVLKSVSRLASSLVSSAHHNNARAILRQLARYDEARVVIESGLFVAGSDETIDEAIAARPAIMQFLQQEMADYYPWDDMVSRLAGLLPGAQMRG